MSSCEIGFRTTPLVAVVPTRPWRTIAGTTRTRAYPELVFSLSHQPSAVSQKPKQNLLADC